MKPNATDKISSPSSTILTQIIRNSLILFLLSAVAVPAICFVFGWRSLESIGTGFIYSSLGMTLFGVLTFSGNTVSAQLFKLSLPKYTPPSLRDHRDAEIDGVSSSMKAIRFLFATLLCGALLVVTGLFFKLL